MGNPWNPDRFGFKFKSFESHYPKKSPWPCMRGNLRNTGYYLPPQDSQSFDNPKELIHFRTENAVFCTPILDGHERIYVGSADHHFYAFDPQTSEIIWAKNFSEVVDSAATIDDTETIYVAAGDGKIHAYSTDGTEKWEYNILLNRIRAQFTFSSLYWYEGNIVVGPDGALYVPNDDFIFYKMTPAGEIIWGFRTGFFIWGAPAFSPEGLVLVAGFDQHLYALEMNTGKCVWSRDLHGSLVSSPAIGENGWVYQCSFSGDLTALTVKDGKIRWKFATGSHIYASPAIAPDHIIYFGSTNGIFYAIDGISGKLKWTFFIGDPIRSSAAIGMDPEGKVSYLIYFGGGDGQVYAVDPQGTLRWAYNSLPGSLNIDYPNINSSIALGNSGLAVGTSTGDILWIPYDYYLRNNPENIAIQRSLTNNELPAVWHYIYPGGQMEPQPLVNIQDILPINTIAIRLLIQNGSNLLPAYIIPKSLQVNIEPSILFQIKLQSNFSAITIIPDEILKLDTEYLIEIKCSYRDMQIKTQSYNQTLHFHVKDADSPNSIIESQSDIHRILHMAIPQPPILPSLNQIGFASLQIPWRILDVSPDHQHFVAWGVQKFGGEGSPLSRVSFYAFAGIVSQDYFLLKASDCLFEITAFTLPLNHFRVGGQLQPEGSVKSDASLLVVKNMGIGLLKLMNEMGGTNPLSTQILWKYLRTAGLGQFFSALRKFFPALLRQTSLTTWRQWGLLNHEAELVGVGTFRLETLNDQSPISSLEVDPQVFQVTDFHYLEKQKQITVKVGSASEELLAQHALAICLIDVATCRPVPLNYNHALSIKRTKNQTILCLNIPKTYKIPLHNHKAILLADLTVLSELNLS